MAISSLPVGISVLFIIFLLRVVVRRIRNHSISHLPGPLPGSWLVGNLPELLRPDNIAEAEFEWTNKYGSVLKIKGALGTDILFSADPKVIQHILNTPGYDFYTPKENVVGAKIGVGEGITFAQGVVHARQRKVMNPALSLGAVRRFLPLFQRISQKTVAKWEEKMAQNGGSSIVIDIYSWLNRTTLDALGQAALDYDFGALDEKNNELSAAYDNIFEDSLYKRSDSSIAFGALWAYLPLATATVLQRLPTTPLKRFRRYTVVARRVAKELVHNAQLISPGKDGGRDVMSILVRANLSEDPKKRLTENEVLAQLRTLMMAGQTPTSLTLTWILYELSKHPDIQARVREEIKAARLKVVQRGDIEFTVADLESMKWLLSVIKETLRYHPITTFLQRESGRKAVIPLSTPLKTKTGEHITITISKGQRIMLSIAAYNRLKSVWGEDAEVWRPERFLEGIEANHETKLGLISNLATFGSGIRSCIGWRFALLQVQAILVEFLERFEFFPAPGNPEIVRSATVLMTPMLKDEPGRGQLPLTVTHRR